MFSRLFKPYTNCTLSKILVASGLSRDLELRSDMILNLAVLLSQLL